MSAAESSSVGLGPSAYRAIVVEEAPSSDPEQSQPCSSGASQLQTSVPVCSALINLLFSSSSCLSLSLSHFVVFSQMCMNVCICKSENILYKQGISVD